MPNTREKLIGLISMVQDNGQRTERKEKSISIWSSSNAELADHLIANGVTVQGAKDINVPSKWIPVTERLPKKNGQYLCNYHFGEYPTMTFTRVLDYYATDIVPHFQHTLGDGSMKVTHWMPLPEPPKGE